MTYLKLDVGFPWHHRVVGLSDKAFRAHVTAMCHARDHLTDGVISLPLVRAWLRARTLNVRVINELCTSHLWMANCQTEEGGYIIRDWLDYNPSRADVDSLAAIRAEAGRLGGEAKAKQIARRSSSNISSESRAEERRAEESRAEVLAAAPLLPQDNGYRDRLGSLETAFGGVVQPDILESFAQIAHEHTQDEIVRAIAEVRRMGKRTYPANLWKVLTPPAPVEVDPQTAHEAARERMRIAAEELRERNIAQWRTRQNGHDESSQGSPAAPIRSSSRDAGGAG